MKTKHTQQLPGNTVRVNNYSTCYDDAITVITTKERALTKKNDTNKYDGEKKTTIQRIVDIKQRFYMYTHRSDKYTYKPVKMLSTSKPPHSIDCVLACLVSLDDRSKTKSTRYCHEKMNLRLR